MNPVRKMINHFGENKVKLVKSFLCFASYGGMGSGISLLGTSLLDYKILIGSSFSLVAYLVQIRSIGYIIGALSAGAIEKYVEQLVILAVTNLALGLALSATPWFTSFIPIAGATLIAGIALGILEIYSHVYIGFLWQEKSTNYLQALHAFFDIGALIAPLITRPFLIPLDPEEYNGQSNGSARVTYTADDVQLHYPHCMLGGFLTLVGFGFALVWLRNRDDQVVRSSEEPKDDQAPGQSERWKRFTALILTALVVNFEFGAQNLVSALGPAFVVKSNLKMGKQEAALLVSVYWATCCLYRLILIPATLYFREKKLILLNSMIIFMGSITMIYGGDENQTIIWIAVILLSIGFSPCFALSFGLVQRYFTIPGKLASYIFLFGTIGESFHPWIVANYMELYSFFYTLYFSTMAIVNALLCIFLVYFTTHMIQSKRNSACNHYETELDS